MTPLDNSDETAFESPPALDHPKLLPSRLPQAPQMLRDSRQPVTPSIGLM